LDCLDSVEKIGRLAKARRAASEDHVPATDERHICDAERDREVEQFPRFQSRKRACAIV